MVGHSAESPRRWTAERRSTVVGAPDLSDPCGRPQRRAHVYAAPLGIHVMRTRLRCR